MKHSQKLQDLLETKDLDISEHSASTCTTGYDNDGSTGFEIFDNGYQLGKAAGDNLVLYVEVDGSAYFFIGDEGVKFEDLEKSLLEFFQELEDEDE